MSLSPEMDGRSHQKLVRARDHTVVGLSTSNCERKIQETEENNVRVTDISDRTDDSGISLYQPTPEPHELDEANDSESNADGNAQECETTTFGQDHVDSAVADGQNCPGSRRQNGCQSAHLTCTTNCQQHSSDPDTSSDDHTHHDDTNGRRAGRGGKPKREKSKMCSQLGSELGPDLRETPLPQSSSSESSAGSGGEGKDDRTQFPAAGDGSWQFPVGSGLVFPPAESFEGQGNADSSRQVTARKRLLSRQYSLQPSAFRTAKRLSLPPVTCMTSGSDEDGDKSREAIFQQLYKEAEELTAKINAVETEKDTSISRNEKLQSELTRTVHQVHDLEDRLRECELKSQSDRKALERDFRVKMARRERQLSHQLDVSASLLTQSEETQVQLRHSEQTLRNQLRTSKEEMEDLVSKCDALSQRHESAMTELSNCHEQTQREAGRTKKVVDSLKEQVAQSTEQAKHWQAKCTAMEIECAHAGNSSAGDDLQAKVSQLRKDLDSQQQKNDELCSLLLLQGKAMMIDGEDSLASEMEVQSKQELMTALRSEQLQSQRLAQYIASLLSLVMEKSPDLLEVTERSF